MGFAANRVGSLRSFLENRLLKTDSAFSQEQSMTHSPYLRTISRSEGRRNCSANGFRTTANLGIIEALRTCTAQLNLNSFAEVHLLGSSCLIRYTRSRGDQLFNLPIIFDLRYWQRRDLSVPEKGYIGFDNEEGGHCESDAMRAVAERAKIPGSATVGIENRVAEMKRAGKNVISLAAGQPDFVTPQHIREYAKKALDEGYTFYPPSRGLPELREVISKKVAKENGIEADPNSEIIVTVGGKQAIFSSILTLVDAGDEVIVADPSWVTYEPCVKLAEGRVVPVPVSEQNQFRLMAEDILKAVTSRTKLIIINSPNNPTGSVLRREDLKEIADVACDKDLFVISDEIYEYLVYDGLKHSSVGSLPGMKERTITANGFSKAYSMTGWRLGYLVGPKQIVQHILAIHEHSVTGPCSFAQKAAAQAMNDPRSEKSIESMVTEFEKRRNVMVQGLNKIPGITCVKPSGAFYSFANISALGRNSMQIANHLLEKALVATVPGSAFGERGEGYLRLSFANSAENITEALDRIRSALGKL